MGIEGEKFGSPSENKEEPEKKKITRRDFLKWTAFAAGSAALTQVPKFIKEDEVEEENRVKKNIKKKWKPKESMKEKTKEEVGKEESKESKKTTPVEKKVEAKNIADIFLKAYYELSSSKRWPPNDVLTSNFYIAQELTESSLDPEAESKKGAGGIMQNMPISVVDVVAYLNKLKRNNEFDYQGPEKISSDQVKEIMDLIPGKADYSRAFGKLYLCALWDQGYGYKVGRKHYEKGNIKKTQRELLGSYNGGYRRIRNENQKDWPEESSKYADKAMNYIERLKRIRNRFNEFGIVLEVKYEDYAAGLMAREMDKPKKLGDKYIMLDDFAKKIKAIADKRGNKINHEDIRIIFEK